MEKEIQFHKYKEMLASVERRLKDCDTVSASNKAIIKKFMQQKKTEGLSLARQIRLLEILKKLAEFVEVDFDKAEKKDIENCVNRIYEQLKWSESTKQSYKIGLKQIYKHLQGNGTKYPAIVEWVQLTKRRKLSKLPEELITEDEVKRLVSACEHPRDRAIVAVLSESGARVSEIFTAKLKSVEFIDGETRIVIHGKSGWRRILLLSSTPFLKEWVLRYHPTPQNKESALFTMISHKCRKGQPMTYAAVRKVLEKAARAAGISKNLHPHLLRHSAASRLCRHLSLPELQSYFGWADLKSAQTYLHLSTAAVEDSLKRMHGKKVDKEEKTELASVVCSVCKHENPYDIESNGNGMCLKCGNPVTVGSAIKHFQGSQRKEEMLAALIESKRLNDARMAELTETVKKLQVAVLGKKV